MRDKVLGLAHFIEPVFPQRLALLSDKIWGMGYHRALTIIKLELKADVLKVLPHTGRVIYPAKDPENPEMDEIISKFLTTEDVVKILKILEENDAKPV